MPFASPDGPSWLRSETFAGRRTLDRTDRGMLSHVVGFLRSTFGYRRPPRVDFGDEPGAAGAGDRSPLVPRSPVLVGAAAKEIPKPLLDTLAIAGRR